MLARLVDKAVGFRMQASGIEYEYRHVGTDLHGEVDQDDVFRAAEGNARLSKCSKAALSMARGFCPCSWFCSSIRLNADMALGLVEVLMQEFVEFRLGLRFKVFLLLQRGGGGGGEFLP